MPVVRLDALIRSLVLALACAFAAAMACSSEGGSASNENGGGGGSSGSDGGSEDSGVIFSPDAFADAPLGALTIDPPTATLTVSDRTIPQTQQFKARLGTTEITPTWSLDQFDIGGMDAAGTFTTGGIVGGTVKVEATYGQATATATVEVFIDLREIVKDDVADPGPSPANETALDGPAGPDPGPDVTTMLYPYDQTVMPRALVAPLVQFSPGTVVPEDVKVTLRGSHFTFNGLYKIKDGARPRFSPPQDIWDAAMVTQSGSTMDVEVVKAAAGVAYGTSKVTIKVAPGPLKGAVYYMTYEAPLNGLYVVKPGEKAPATQLKAGCVVCHSVSANGKVLSTGAEVNNPSNDDGMYSVNGDGTITKLTDEPAGLGGDTRGISFGVFTPDGKWVTRSANNFWGGPNMLAWKVDSVTPSLIPATVVGIGDAVSAFLPAFSPDGKRYGFTSGGAAGQPGTPSRSISVMDVTTDETTGPGGTLTFSNLQVVADNGASGATAKYVTFMPDSERIVLQEGDAWYGSYSGMLPSYDGANYGQTAGKLWFINTATTDHLECANANNGLIPTDAVHNYEPFALPAQAAGYFWVVFTSIRQYGNTHLPGEERKQLWIAAITPGSAPGVDPSHPPIYLPNQSQTKNERGFWALEPCETLGELCSVDEDCCMGQCRPADPTDPASAKTCLPYEDECVPNDEACTSDADCCEVDTGVHCVGGFCAQPIPQ